MPVYSCFSLFPAGCAFVTFFRKLSADRAMDQLHDKKTLHGVGFLACLFALVYICRIAS